MGVNKAGHNDTRMSYTLYEAYDDAQHGINGFCGLMWLAWCSKYGATGHMMQLLT